MTSRDLLLEALKERFGDELVVFLERASYFHAKDLREHVSGEREIETVGDSSVSCVRGDNLEVWYFPSKLPELNAVEGCWDQLQEWSSIDSFLISQRWKSTFYED